MQDTSLEPSSQSGPESRPAAREIEVQLVHPQTGDTAPITADDEQDPYRFAERTLADAKEPKPKQKTGFLNDLDRAIPKWAQLLIMLVATYFFIRQLLWAFGVIGQAMSKMNPGAQ